MRARFVSALVIAAATWPVYASEHVVAPADVSARLAEARGARAGTLTDVAALLATPAATRAAERAGVQPARLHAALTSLSDAELNELAARARALQSDPTAGLDRDIHDLLVLFLIIAIVVLVLRAVD